MVWLDRAARRTEEPDILLFLLGHRSAFDLGRKPCALHYVRRRVWRAYCPSSPELRLNQSLGRLMRAAADSACDESPPCPDRRGRRWTARLRASVRIRCCRGTIRTKRDTPKPLVRGFPGFRSILPPPACVGRAANLWRGPMLSSLLPGAFAYNRALPTPAPAWHGPWKTSDRRQQPVAEDL